MTSERDSTARRSACGATIRFTLFNGAADTGGRPRTAASWPAFVGGLREALEAEAAAKTALPAIGPFVLSLGASRTDAGVEAVTLLALDVDGLPAAELPEVLARLRPLAAVAHASPSDGGPEAQIRKLRIYALPSRAAITPAECRAARLAFAAMLGVTCDRAALNPSRILFAGRITGTAPRELWAFEGAPVDVDAFLASAPAETTHQALLRAPPDAPPLSAIELAGSCVLGRALVARKAVLGTKMLARGPAAVIKCPNADAHDRHGAASTDESALYLPPTIAGHVGTITCVRSACAGHADWLTFMSDEELEAAGVHLVRIRDVYTGNIDSAGRARIGVRLVGLDLQERYLRCSVGTGTWRALFDAGYLEHGADPRRLVGAWIGVTLGEDDRVTRVYRVEGPRAESGAA